MPEEFGIKETKEAALGAMALGFYMAKMAKDGIDFADLTAFLGKLQSDPVFADKIQAAYDGVEMIPAEIKDLSLSESLQLATVIIPAVISEINGMAPAA